MINAVIMALAIVFHADGTVTSGVTTMANTKTNMDACKIVAERIYEEAEAKDQVARVTCQVVTSSPTVDANESN